MVSPGPDHRIHHAIHWSDRYKTQFIRSRRNLCDDRLSTEQSFGQNTKIDTAFPLDFLAFGFVPFELHLYLQS